MKNLATDKKFFFGNLYTLHYTFTGSQGRKVNILLCIHILNVEKHLFYYVYLCILYFLICTHIYIHIFDFFKKNLCRDFLKFFPKVIKTIDNIPEI